MSVTLIAIDPGASGGIAVLSGASAAGWPMPDTVRDLCDMLLAVRVGSDGVKCYMEEVGGYVGGVGQPGSAMFAFGKSVGQVEGVLVGLGIPFETVRPQKWQKGLGVVPKITLRGDYTGMSPEEAQAERKRIANLNAAAKREQKNKLKDFAQRLFPGLKVTLKNCDALLILEYARRLENGQLTAASMPPSVPVENPPSRTEASRAPLLL